MFSPKCSFKIRRYQVWLFRRISAFPVQALFTLFSLDCVDYFPCYSGCNIYVNIHCVREKLNMYSHCLFEFIPIVVKHANHGT